MKNADRDLKNNEGLRPRTKLMNSNN